MQRNSDYLSRRNVLKSGITTTVAGLGIATGSSSIAAANDSEPRVEAQSVGSMHDEFDCGEVDWSSSTYAGEYSLSINRTLTHLRSNHMNGYQGVDDDGHLYEFTLSAFGADACRTENDSFWSGCSTAKEDGTLTPFENRGQKMSVELTGGSMENSYDFDTVFNYEDPYIYGRSHFTDDEFVDHDEWVKDDLDTESFNVERESDFVAGIGTAFGLGSKAVSGGLASMFSGLGMALSAGSLALSLASDGSGEGEMTDDGYTFELDSTVGDGGSNQWFEHYMYFSVYVPEGETCTITVEDSFDDASLAASGHGGWREEVSDETYVKSYLNTYDTESWSISITEQDESEEHPSAWIY